MANLLAAFAKGFADDAGGQIADRRKLEQEEKKARMIAQLKQETDQANFLFEEGYKDKLADSKLTSVDSSTGERILRNRRGEEVGRVKLTKDELDELNFARQKEKLSLDNIASQIADRARDSARQDRVAEAQIGSYSRANRGGRGGSLDGSDDESRAPSSLDIAEFIRKDYAADITEITSNYDVNQMDITEMSEKAAAATMKFAKERKPGELYDAARIGFRQALYDLTRTRPRKVRPTEYTLEPQKKR